MQINSQPGGAAKILPRIPDTQNQTVRAGQNLDRFCGCGSDSQLRAVQKLIQQLLRQFGGGQKPPPQQPPIQPVYGVIIEPRPPIQPVYGGIIEDRPPIQPVYGAPVESMAQQVDKTGSTSAS
ncbi:MAG: hypothetical protein ACFCUJ_02710 [Thiotrichales bacterium]